MLSPRDDLFKKTEPHQYYEPIQKLLNGLHTENEIHPWQSGLYTRQISEVVKTFLEDDLNFRSEISHENYEAVFRFLGAGNPDLGYLNHAVADPNLQNIWQNTRLYADFDEKTRDLLTALFKISVAYSAYETLNEPLCTFNAEDKENYKKQLCMYIRRHYNRVYRRHRLGDDQSDIRNFNLALEVLTWVLQQYKRSLAIFNLQNLKRLYNSDLNLKDFLWNLGWVGLKGALVFASASFFMVFFVAPFMGFIWAIEKGLQFALHRRWISERNYRKLNILFISWYLMVGGALSLWLGGLVAINMFSSFLGGAIALNTTATGLAGALITIASYVSQCMVYGFLGSVGIAAFPIVALGAARLGKSLYSLMADIEWQSNIAEKNRVIQNNQPEFDEITTLEEVDDLLTASINIPLNEQVVLTQQEVVQLKARVIAERLESPNPMLNELLLQAYQDSWDNVAVPEDARGFLPRFRFRRMDENSTFDGFKAAVAAELERQVRIDDTPSVLP